MAKNKEIELKNETLLLDKNTPFLIQEAYKTLRTNIMFSMPDEKCKKIIISSAFQGEGKSSTAINLALAFANNGSKILLIDCDLRLPTLHKKLNIEQTPGLTNLLYGVNTADSVIQHLPSGLDVITCGYITSNPSETLGAERMEKLMTVLSNHYEYIIMDTPPICTVTDAAILSKTASGVILVARKGVAEYKKIDEALNHFKMAGANILGFVFVGTEGIKKNYGKKYSRYGKYGKYGKYGYYKNYDYGYNQ